MAALSARLVSEALAPAFERVGRGDRRLHSAEVNVCRVASRASCLVHTHGSSGPLAGRAGDRGGPGSEALAPGSGSERVARGPQAIALIVHRRRMGKVCRMVAWYTSTARQGHSPCGRVAGTALCTGWAPRRLLRASGASKSSPRVSKVHSAEAWTATPAWRMWRSIRTPAGSWLLALLHIDMVRGNMSGQVG